MARTLYLVHFDAADRSMRLSIDRDSEGFELAPGLWLVATSATRSQLYHAVKRQLAPEALLVAELSQAPKFKGMTAGAMKWLRNQEPSLAARA